MHDFEKWLMDKFHKTDGQSIFDDDLPDAFDGWIENLDIDDWFKLGEEYKNETKKELNIIYDLMRDGQFMEARRRLGVLLGYEHNTK